MTRVTSWITVVVLLLTVTACGSERAPSDPGIEMDQLDFVLYSDASDVRDSYADRGVTVTDITFDTRRDLWVFSVPSEAVDPSQRQAVVAQNSTSSCSSWDQDGVVYTYCNTYTDADEQRDAMIENGLDPDEIQFDDERDEWYFTVIMPALP